MRSYQALATVDRQPPCYRFTYGDWVVLAGHPRPSPALGDAVKVGSFWFDGVTVDRIEDGKIYYYNNAGTEYVKPLDQLAGLKLDKYPQLAQYDAATNNNASDDALKAVIELSRTAQEPWLRQHALYLMANAYSKAGQAVPAVETFLQLAYTRPPEYYLLNVQLGRHRQRR